MNFKASMFTFLHFKLQAWSCQEARIFKRAHKLLTHQNAESYFHLNSGNEQELVVSLGRVTLTSNRLALNPLSLHMLRVCITAVILYSVIMFGSRQCKFVGRWRGNKQYFI